MPSEPTAIRTHSHPFVCPDCETRTGVRELRTGLSTCASCGLQWRGPRVGLASGDADRPVLREIAGSILATEEEQR